MVQAVLQGDLSAFRLPEVLTFLSTGRRTGMLSLAWYGREAWLYFEEGALIHAGSNQEQFRLGQILLRRKRITREQAQRLERLIETEGGRFGELAVREGLLPESELLEVLKIQVSEVVFDAFVWEGGTFGFRLDASLPPNAVTIAIDLPNLIMEGARRIAEWEQCLRLLPDSGARFKVVAAPADEKITLTSEEWKILFLINGQRTLNELCHDSREEAFHVYRIVYGLLANKLIEPAARVEEGDSTGGQASSGDPDDLTVRQGSPQFGAETTVSDAFEDDTSLLVSSEARLSYADVVRPTVAQLRFVNGDGSDLLIALTEPEYLLGRHRDNSIQLADLGVSSFHSRIYRGPEGYILEDLKSRNGTWVNGSRVTYAPLSHGDTIHLGQTDLTYEVLWAS
jgi:hypothetical protein